MKNQNLVEIAALKTIEDQKAYINALSSREFDKLMEALESGGREFDKLMEALDEGSQYDFHQACLDRDEAEFDAAAERHLMTL